MRLPIQIIRYLIIASLALGAGSHAARPTWSTPDRPSHVPDEVVVVLHAGASVQQFPAELRQNLRAAGRSTRSPAGSTLQRFRIGTGQSVREMVATLRQQPGVRAAGPNYIYYRSAAPGDTLFNQQWGLHNTGQSLNTVPSSNGTSDADIDWLEVWEYPVPATAVFPASSNVKIAVIDDGVAYDHPDLAGAMWDASSALINSSPNHGWDFADNDNDPYPGLGSHGTHVAGIAAATADNSANVAGVASGVKIMALKVFSDFFWDGAFTSDISNAIDYATGNGADVINMSLGGPGEKDDVLEIAIQDAVTAGTVVVAAAGNGNASGVGLNNDITAQWPANFANEPTTASGTLSVAATTPGDGRASFSNYGANTVTLGAPGFFIYSTIVDRTRSDLENGGSAGTGPADCASNPASCMDNTLFDGGASSDCIGSNCTWGWIKDSNTNTGEPGDTSFRIEADRGATSSFTANANGTITSAPVDMSAYGSSRLHLQYEALWDMECNNDYVDLQVSTDGTTWSAPLRADASLWSALNPVTNQFSYCLSTHTHTGIIGQVADDINNPITFAHDLSAYAGATALQFRLVFHSNGSANNTTIPGGFYIKNIRISTPVPDSSPYYGTSMATPMVSGVAALVKSLNPAYTAAQIKQAISLNVDPVASMASTTASGGRLNAFKALYQAGLTSLAPAYATRNAPDTVITVNGINFASDSIVRWNGTDLGTVFVSASQLTATVPAANLAASALANITVFNPTANTSSRQLVFTVYGPGIDQLTPASVARNSPATTITVDGVNFEADALVRWNGSDLATSYVSPTRLTAIIPATSLATVGSATITVYNVALNEISNPATFTISEAVSRGGGGGGCFIATAAFGTAMAPQVGVLRVFRDNWLLTDSPGRWFVKQYYRYSPPLADHLRGYEGLRAIVRASLMPLIRASLWLQETFGNEPDPASQTQ